jgi:hypothetical protein
MRNAEFNWPLPTLAQSKRLQLSPSNRERVYLSVEQQRSWRDFHATENTAFYCCVIGGTCLQKRCLETPWANPLQYTYFVAWYWTSGPNMQLKEMSHCMWFIIAVCKAVTDETYVGCINSQNSMTHRWVLFRIHASFTHSISFKHIRVFPGSSSPYSPSSFPILPFVHCLPSPYQYSHFLFTIFFWSLRIQLVSFD